MNTSHLLTRASLVLGLLTVSSCHLIPDMPDPLNFPEAKARNLEELHSESGNYNYNATLLDDFGFLIELMTGKDRSSALSKSPVQNPAAETMVNLIDLMAASPKDPSTGNLQVQWCARLCASDPSAIVRERAALGLGEVGVWAGVDSLKAAPPGIVYATPEEVGAALEGILRGLRVMREGEDEGASLEAASAYAHGLYLNVEGAWRLLSATDSLMGRAPDLPSEDRLRALTRHLRVRLVEEGLFSALSDSSDLVRAAGLRSVVKIGGPDAMTGLLSQPMPGWSDTVILGLVDLVAQYGLPGGEDSELVRGKCLASLLGWAVDHPAARVRARSMIALQRIAPDGPRSLREEDWNSWGQSVGARPGDSS